MNSMLKSHHFRCPSCNKSMVEMDWKAFDEVVARTPMPDDYQGWTVQVLCNDCSAKSTLAFHVAGHKCAACGGYNTAVLHTHRPQGQGQGQGLEGRQGGGPAG